MKKIISIILLVLSILLVNYSRSFSQQELTLGSEPTASWQTTLDDALKCIKMTPNDLTFRDDYVDVDSFRLKLIDSFMHKPLDVILFNNSISQDFKQATLSSELDLIPSFAAYLQAKSIEDLLSNREARDFGTDPEANRFLMHYSKASKDLPFALRNSLCYLFEGLYLADSLSREAFVDLNPRGIRPGDEI